jgi:hypothetical protein
MRGLVSSTLKAISGSLTGGSTAHPSRQISRHGNPGRACLRHRSRSRPSSPLPSARNHPESPDTDPGAVLVNVQPVGTRRKWMSIKEIQLAEWLFQQCHISALSFAKCSLIAQLTQKPLITSRTLCTLSSTKKNVACDGLRTLRDSTFLERRTVC